MSWGHAVAIAVGVLLPEAAAQATTVTFADFSSTAGLTLTGAAASVSTADGHVLRLTPAVTYQSGSAFGTQLIRVHDFSSTFSFRMTDAGGITDDKHHLGADGITFTVQPVSASIGGDGRNIGIGGVTPAVSVEFDTFWNEDPTTQDPSSSHLGLDIDGNVHSVTTTDITPFLNDGNRWYAWIDYDGQTLSVRVSESATKPAAPQLSYALDLHGTLGTDSAYVGFTAATGGGYQNHDIIEWTYFDHYVAPAAGGGSSGQEAGGAAGGGAGRVGAGGGAGGAAGIGMGSQSDHPGGAGGQGGAAGSSRAGSGGNDDPATPVPGQGDAGCGCQAAGPGWDQLGWAIAVVMVLTWSRRRRPT
jgi:MYXO-CTERM domain-containing protein